MPRPYNDAVMTAAGAALLDKVRAGLAAIEFTRMVTGDGTYTAEEKISSALRECAGLKSSRNSYALSSVSTVPGGGVKLTALFTDQDPVTGEVLVTEGYYINEIGLYAKEKDADDSTEVLYSITVAAGDIGDYMPAYTGGAPVQIVQEYRARVSDAAAVSISCAGAVMLAEDAERRFSAIEERVEAAGGGPIEDQTLTFEEAETRDNIANGDSLGTILGKIKKFFAGLKEVAFTGSYNDLTDTPVISGEFDKVGCTDYFSYANIKKVTGGIGSFILVLPDISDIGDLFSFTVHIGGESRTVEKDLDISISGVVLDNISWKRGFAQYTNIHGSDLPVRFGYSRSMNRLAVSVGLTTAHWGTIFAYIRDFIGTGSYGKITERWDFFVSSTDFVENTSEDWATRRSLYCNAFSTLSNYVSGMAGNLLKGSLLTLCDLLGNGLGGAATWVFGGNVNLYNEDPYGGRSAAGIQLYSSDNHLSTKVGTNDPIKITGVRYKLSVWLRATKAMNIRLTINHYNGSYTTCNVTTEWKKFEFTSGNITTITSNNHVVIGGFGTLTASPSDFFYVYCPKLEYA